MIKKTVLLLMLASVSLGVTVLADDWNDNKLKTITGTLTCPACDLKHLAGANAQCEAFGHRHALRQNDGQYVYFLENDHADVLIKGGGRHDTEISVTGIYNKKSRTLDVQSYEIDGLKTEWCVADKRMDMCASSKAASASK